MFALPRLQPIAVATALALLPTATFAFDWKIVSNYDDEAPGGEAGAVFRSYNQPSIDLHGLVVFRGGRSGQRAHVSCGGPCATASRT